MINIINLIRRRKSKKIFLLEDDPFRKKKIFDMIMSKYPKTEIFHAHNYTRAIEILSEHKEFDLIMLDHDLIIDYSGCYLDYRTGEDVAIYISENQIKYKRAIIHSVNYSGSEHIFNRLDKLKTVKIPVLILKSRHI